MKVLLFDTETTGLPISRASAKEGPNNWPHIVSISWILLDADTNTILKKVYRIVKPLNWTIPEDSVRIHGITTEHALQNGVSLKSVMDEFRSERCDIMVAHNMDFDYNVLINAIQWDLYERFIPFNQKQFCSMKLSRNLCKLPSDYGYKSPKLSELYRFVFKKDPTSSSLHNSLYDTEILTEIIQHCKELRSQMGLPVNSVDKARNVYQTLPHKTLSFRLSDST